MDWLAVNAERRGDPRVMWPDVRSVIMLGVNYGPEHDPRDVLPNASAPRFRFTRKATIITT